MTFPRPQTKLKSIVWEREEMAQSLLQSPLDPDTLRALLLGPELQLGNPTCCLIFKTPFLNLYSLDISHHFYYDGMLVQEVPIWLCNAEIL